jgi:hypothetical protein
MSQLILTSDPLTTTTVGAFEYDGVAMYATPVSAQRGVIKTEQFIILQSPYTLTSQTAAQAMFNAPINGQVTLTTGTYQFECLYSLSSMSASSGAFGFALGGTATTTQSWMATARKSALTDTATTNPSVTSYNITANTGLVAANTVTTGFARVNGTVIVTVAGTLIPQVSLGVAAAAVVGVGSYFRISPLGTTTVTSVGNWS